MNLDFLLINDQKIAFSFGNYDQNASNPILVYLGGLASSLDGTKASLIDDWAKKRGYDCLRFDYRGHGSSDGKFTDFGVADWVEDAQQVVERIAKRNVILIGSSMGGWVGTCLLKRIPQKISGFIGIAVAPDFVDREFLPQITDQQIEEAKAGKIIEIPSEGYPEPYYISHAMISRSREVNVLSSQISANCPVRLLHGLSDHIVKPEIGLALAQHIETNNLKIEYLKGADHGFSCAQGMQLIFDKIDEIVKF